MAQQEEAAYDRRSVSTWVDAAQAGEVTITDFQRSFVWDSGKATAYIKAILMGKPVGLYLILKASKKPQFEPRPFNNINTPLGSVAELVLDGQQRLTSLLHALHGHPDRRFFVKVVDFSAEFLEVDDVVCESKSATTGKTVKGLDDPVKAYLERMIPMDILSRTGPREGRLSPLATWCIEIGKSVEWMEGDEVRWLEDRIANFVDRCFFQRNLWYCSLPEATGPEEATDIFVATNTSSVKIKRFDIEVAKTRGRLHHNLRTKVQEAYDTSDMLCYYFSEDPEDHIPDIGEWMLKVACLHAELPPKESNYAEAIKYLLESRGQEDRLKNVFLDLDWALRRVEGFGAASDKMIPSWPVLHVLSAIRRKIDKIKDPTRKNAARQLLNAYYWRCLFSNRHAEQANDRLFEDFRQLSKALNIVEGDGPKINAFDERDHPLHDQDHLMRHAGWIGSGRLGKALASAVMASDPKPIEWMTGESMTATTIRELQGMRKLDRHHIYPRATLRVGGVEDELIQNGLNGVLLDQRTNLRLWKVPPSEYVDKMLVELKTVNTTESDLRNSVESHLVPYEELKSANSTIEKRYLRFLQKRAELLAARIQVLARNPSS